MDEYSAGFCIRATRGGGGGAGTKCGRWNPTSEQVKVLTDLFRSGLRTPSTDQIQKISSQLSFYGKIESKNVFYWFQNHKARERQKRRRVSVDHQGQGNNITNDIGTMHLHDSAPNPLSTKQFGSPETNQVLERERVVETLQLFPLNSADSEKIKFFADHDHYKANTTSFTYMEMDHATLDLRLSFF